MPNMEEVSKKSFDKEVESSLAFLQYDQNLNPINELNNKLEVGRAFYQLAKVHYDKSDLDFAEVNFLKSLEFSERPKDNFSILKILGFLIRIASEKKDTEKAQEYVRFADDIVDELSRVLGSLNAEYFYNLGVVKTYKGQFEVAKENFLLCEKMCRQENEPELLSKCLLALAMNCYWHKDFPKAALYLESLENLLLIIEKSYIKGAMYLFSAKVQGKLKNFDKALDSYKKANQILQTKKCWNLYGYVLFGKGNIYKQKGDLPTASIFYEMALTAIDSNTFKHLDSMVRSEIEDLNDASVDIYLDYSNRQVTEKSLGNINFKHRFVLLEILMLLAKNAGSYHDKEDLARSIWKDEYNPLIHDKLIYTSVSRLRKLIEPQNEKGIKRKYIVRGKDGYTFNLDAKVRFHKQSRPSVHKNIANVEISSPV